MKNRRILSFAVFALASVTACAAQAQTSNATVTRVEERQVLSMSAYATVEDAVRDLRRSSSAVHMGNVPTDRIYAVRAKTAAGKPIELVAKTGPAPQAGDAVQFDPRTHEIVR